MAHSFQVIYSCTPAQLETCLVTTLPAVGFVVLRAPIQYQGKIKGSAAGTGTSATMGEIDFSYDGKYFLRFYGANPAPAAQQTYAGVPTNQMSDGLVTFLNTTLAATLGAPVPSNLANVPSKAVDA